MKTWTLLEGVGDLLFLISLVWILLSMMRGNRRSARVVRGGGLKFAPARLTVWAWLFVIGFQAQPFAVDYIKGRISPWGLIILACLVFLTIAILFRFPETIIVSNEGLDQFHWFSKNKRILWKDIVNINAAKSGPVRITGADGTKIVHSFALADRPRFLLELKQHCGGDMSMDLPRETVASR